MRRTTMFSTVFPAHHKRRGEPTYFVEKIISGLVRNDVPGYGTETVKALRDLGVLDIKKALEAEPKGHTIRAGHRYSPGDFMVMKIWSGKPYRSKQITLGPPVEIVNTWDIRLELVDCVYHDGAKEIKDKMKFFIASTDFFLSNDEQKIARNDGLTHQDWLDWFPKPFEGQIIAWDKSISY